LAATTAKRDGEQGEKAKCSTYYGDPYHI